MLSPRKLFHIHMWHIDLFCMVGLKYWMLDFSITNSPDIHYFSIIQQCSWSSAHFAVHGEGWNLEGSFMITQQVFCANYYYYYYFLFRPILYFRCAVFWWVCAKRKDLFSQLSWPNRLQRSQAATSAKLFSCARPVECNSEWELMTDRNRTGCRFWLCIFFKMCGFF